MKTEQEIFDIVAEHLLGQMEKSGRPHNYLYRGPRGLKCALGVLILDEEYNKEMEDKSSHYLFSQFPDQMQRCGLKQEYGSFIRQLQYIHDAYEPREWMEKLEETANRFTLETNVLSEKA